MTWINIWRIEETTNYCKWNWGICYYCYYYLFIDILWDPALCCDDFVCEFEFLLYWPFHTYNSQFVLICFCVHIHILPLCCMLHLLIFLRGYLAFVIPSVSILLAFMPCSQNLAFPSLTYRRPPGLLPAHSLAGATLPTPYHRSFNNLLLHFFLSITHFVFCFILSRNFYFDRYNVHQKH